MKIIVSNFVLRQAPGSRFSYYNGNWADIVNHVIANWDKQKPSYRDGVITVEVPADRYFSSTCTLQDGDKLVGEFSRRVALEKPRKSTTTPTGAKTPAKRVDIVLYHKDVLAESNENTQAFYGWQEGEVGGRHFNRLTLCTHQDMLADWEIISINASPTEQEEPMSPGTLMANHFHVPGSNDGGTSTGLSDAEFIEKLRVSYEYWNDKAKASEEE